jgi:large subunit ribosomal protein L21
LTIARPAVYSGDLRTGLLDDPGGARAKAFFRIQAMYAVIKTGGKQYRVAKDDVIIVERLAGEAGDKIEIDQVLLLDDGKGPTLGTPLVDGARVAATVLDQSRGDKIIVFKKKRRKNYRRTMGHRQDLTVLRITDILAKGKKATRSRAKAKADDEAPEAEAAEAVAEEVAATETPEASEEAAKPAPRKSASRAKKAEADAPADAEPEAEEAAPKRKRAAKPKAAAEDTQDDAAGDAGDAEEKS